MVYLTGSRSHATALRWRARGFPVFIATCRDRRWRGDPVTYLVLLPGQGTHAARAALARHYSPHWPFRLEPL